MKLKKAKLVRPVARIPFLVLRVGFLLWVVSFSLSAQPAAAGPIENLSSGTWYEVPNSKISAVLPNPLPPGGIGPEGVITAWNGGAYDSTRDRYIVFGGGHNDYGGNEIYSFDIATLKWSRIWGPSTNIPGTNGSCNEAYSDGNPSSRHTYDGLEYLPNVDRFWVHGGSLYCGSGNAGAGTWTFDFNASVWSRKANIPTCSQLEMVSAYDPATGHIFANGPASCNALLEYDPVANTWTQRGSNSVNYGMVAAIDSKRRKMVAIGNGGAYVFNLTPSGTITRQTLNTTGATEILSGAHYPGFEYDPVSDRFVAWNGGASVYALNMDTSAWVKIAPAATNSVIPTAPPPAGTFGRFRYIPSKNVFIVVNDIDQNVFIYKLTEIPPPDVNPPKSPLNLQVN